MSLFRSALLHPRPSHLGNLPLRLRRLRPCPDKELRTDFKNRQVNSPVNGVAPHGFGFAYQWLLLTPANQSELRFRYLRQQRMDDHKTFVLGFVQTPNQVKIPGKFSWAGKEASFFFQGIVWIDQSAFDVVRLRTQRAHPFQS
jgi:hypothetical protein